MTPPANPAGVTDPGYSGVRRHLLFALARVAIDRSVADDDQSKARRHRHLWRRVMFGLAVCVGLLIIFHRPILLAIGRQFALRYATKENLKMDFRLEGNPFSYLTIRNLHAMPTGPSAIESLDVDSLYLDYSLFGFVRHGISHLLQDVEARGAQVVLNPARAPPPKPHPK